jgi:hypothetical protein
MPRDSPKRRLYSIWRLELHFEPTTSYVEYVVGPLDVRGARCITLIMSCIPSRARSGDFPNIKSRGAVHGFAYFFVCLRL